MAIPSPAYWYVNSVAWTAVTAWATGTVKAIGALVRQSAAPSVGNERVFLCLVAGTTHASTEPTWVVTKGATTTDNTVTWIEVTGQAAMNGSLTYTSGWTAGPGGVGTGVKGQAVAQGYIIARDSGASYQICTTAGTAGSGSEPSFSNTAGTTTADNTITWTSLGVVGGYTTAFGGPHARIANAFAATWGAAGDIFWEGDNHAETQTTAMTNTSPGTNALPCYIYCVDHTKTSPATGDLLATATVTTTGNSAMSISGFHYWYGTIFSAGSGAVSAALNVGTGATYWQRYDSCSFRKLGTSGSTSAINIGQSSANAQSLIEWNNCTVQFGSTGDSMALTRCQFTWKGTSSAILGAAFPTTFMQTSNNVFGMMTFDGVDLSALGSGKTLIALSTQALFLLLAGCKLGASVTIASSPTAHTGGKCDLVNCDSGTVTSRQERYWYQGTQVIETTDVRTGGASDGTTPISWKITSTANSTWTSPYQAFPIAIWNSTAGSSVTATVEIMNDGTTLNNDDIWMEVQYFGSASSTLVSFANDTKANNLATGSALTTSVASWTTSGISSPVTQKMAVTFTPQLAGYIYATVYVAKVSKVIYVDPLITLS